MCATNGQRGQSQRGQTAALAPVALLLTALIVAGLVRVGGHLIAKAHAQSVADAVALAAAAGGRQAAAGIATANGATLVRCEIRGSVAQVEVEVSGHRASATAERYRPAPHLHLSVLPLSGVHLRVATRPPRVLAAVSQRVTHLH